VGRGAGVEGCVLDGVGEERVHAQERIVRGIHRGAVGGIDTAVSCRDRTRVGWRESRSLRRATAAKSGDDDCHV
jgi:hypothetical protein